MLILAIAFSQIISGSVSTLTQIITKYGYFAIFSLMALEGASIPIPSEVVMPLVGLFSSKGMLSLPFAFLAGILGSAVGLAVDYYIAYFVGKDIVYKHLQKFHIKKQSLDAFDKWFERNGVAAVFITKFIPLIRTLVSFPAGFARMSKAKFFGYSLLGSAIWNIVLMLFGYYVGLQNNITIILVSVGLFGIVLYMIYAYALRRMRKG